MDVKTLVRELKTLDGLFKGNKPIEEIETIALHLLRDLTDVEIMRMLAAVPYVKSAVFPSFNELLLLGCATDSSSTDQDRAWDLAKYGIAASGSYRHTYFRPPIINAVIRAIGGTNPWIDFCDARRDREHFVRHEFHEAYKRIQSSGFEQVSGGPLSGDSQKQEVCVVQFINGKPTATMKSWKAAPSVPVIEHTPNENAIKKIAPRKKTHSQDLPAIEYTPDEVTKRLENLDA